ncbi:keratin, type I cytoskeletal 9-like isoform X3 [Panicum virgatum]|uniref:keratin, type I cytoskeletal 9-like isoform X3 n=1 Tax=Panicum virgatum TaxID=38727 RepID=UPI0019D64526|nr:keratin, type I cytoskeletal 9-like isoform X3 [Panicum virgatum]
MSKGIYIGPRVSEHRSFIPVQQTQSGGIGHLASEYIIRSSAPSSCGGYGHGWSKEQMRGHQGEQANVQDSGATTTGSTAPGFATNKKSEYYGGGYGTFAKNGGGYGGKQSEYSGAYGGRRGTAGSMESCYSSYYGGGYGDFRYDNGYGAFGPYAYGLGFGGNPHDLGKLKTRYQQHIQEMTSYRKHVNDRESKTVDTNTTPLKQLATVYGQGRREYPMTSSTSSSASGWWRSVPVE